MAVEDVVVEIGAKIDKLADAVNQSKAKIDELTESSAKTAHSMTAVWAEAVLEIAGKVGEAIKKIIEFTEHMAELGERTESLSRMLGVSTETIGALGVMARATGSDVEGLALTGERMMISIARSERDALNPAAQALRRLGLTAQEFKGLNAEQAFLKLADATQKFAANMNMSTTLTELGGRGMQRLLPLLTQGGEGMRAFAERAKASGATLDETTTKNLAKLNMEIALLKGSLTGLGALFIGAFSEIALTVIQKITEWVGKLSAAIRFLRDGLGFAPPAKEGEEKPDVGAQQAKLADELKMLKEAQDHRIAMANEAAKGSTARVDAEFKMYQLSERSKTNLLLENSREREAIEIDALRKKAAIEGTMPSERRAIEHQITLEQLKGVHEREALSREETLTVADNWKHAIGDIQSAWDGQLRDVLAGTKTFAEAMKLAFGDLVIMIIKEMEKALISILAVQTAKAGLNIATGGIGGAIVGGLFPGLNKFQEGTPNVLQTQLAVVHQGEMIIPSGVADMIRSGQTSIGGSKTSISIQAWDGASVDGWLRGGGGRKLAQHIAKTWDNNRDLRAKF